MFESLLFLAPSAAVRGGIYRRGAKYNADFKQRIVRSVLEAAAQGFPRGWNQRISTQYRVSPAYLSKLKARVERMDSSPSLSETVELYYGSYQGGTQEPLLREDIMCYLLVVIEKDPTLYIWEMKLLLEHQFGIEVSESTIARSLHRAGVSHKKLTKVNQKRFTYRNLVWRYNYLKRVLNDYRPEHLFFFDESCFDHDDADRVYGWGSEQRIFMAADYSRTPSVQLLAMVGLSGVQAADAFLGTTNQEKVLNFFVNVVYAHQPPNTCIIMDNARHHHGRVERFLIHLFATKHVEIVYLPPYSPDLSPIENFFGLVKFFLKDDRHLYVQDRFLAITNAIKKVQPYHFYSFYKQCGYVE